MGTAMTSADDTLYRLMEKGKGILRLRPNYVRRVYVDGGRLSGGRPGGTFNPRDSLWRPERWVASGTPAVNPHPIPGEGLSQLADGPWTLVDAFRMAGERLLGPERYRAHGAKFRVLVKVLDGIMPIPFHFHPSDAAVRRDPKHFRDARFGKDEAYYFLKAPKGPCPFTHVGLHPGTTMGDLRRAMACGADAVLELSPFFLQKFEEGFFLPGGVIHRPGTALALEIQQPCDASVRLEDHVGDRKLSPQEMHAGFDRLEQALRHLDLKASTQRDIIERNRLVPRPVSPKPIRGGSEDWIFPPTICSKFSGKRLRVRSRLVTVEDDCYALLVWKGAGRIGPHRVRSGDEFFVNHEAARAGVAIECHGEPLELFKCFAAPIRV